MIGLTVLLAPLLLRQCKGLASDPMGKTNPRSQDQPEESIPTFTQAKEGAVDHGD